MLWVVGVIMVAAQRPLLLLLAFAPTAAALAASRAALQQRVGQQFEQQLRQDRSQLEDRVGTLLAEAPRLGR